MAELFQKDQSVIARHINNALKEGELEENSNMHFLHNTQYKYRPTKIYDLDTIICVHNRVGSAVHSAGIRLYAEVRAQLGRQQVGEPRRLVQALRTD